MGRILTRIELTKYAEKWREQHLKIVLTNGCYDLLHVGHLRTFKEAKTFGDILIVGLNSDQSVRGLKGDTRPILSQEDRAELVAALQPVDFVTIFDERTASCLIELIKPQVYVKGGDYTLDSLPEKDVIRQFGVEVKFIPLVTGNSTTGLIERIKNANF